MKAATNHISRIAQLGERQTEDLKVTCSIHVSGTFFFFVFVHFDFKLSNRSFKGEREGRGEGEVSVLRFRFFFSGSDEDILHSHGPKTRNKNWISKNIFFEDVQRTFYHFNSLE